jgi:glycosyltransferase involved in cell wall biosynthesis
MKIIFLCGSLEPGRDGVGDYTRRLAIEMIKHGNQVAAVALNDWHLANEFLGIQNAENTDLEILRLPSAWATNKRFARAKEWIDVFDPEWLSLQFVNFAFHSKGLHFGLGNKLATIGKGRKWHIMFHELWVGMAVEAKFKHILWGRLQKLLIKDLIKNLKPLVIHTQSSLYKIQLLRLGFKVDYLPLFSNIPTTYKNLGNNFIQTASQDNEKNISFVVFGTVHPSSPVEVFAKEAANYAQKNNLKISIIFIGRSGAELNRWVNVLESEGLSVKLLGEQPPDTISKVLSTSSIGISTSSIAYIEKSGSVVAMIEHGLPVICISKSEKLLDMQYVAPPYGILEYKSGNLEECLNMKFDLPYINIIFQVSTLMEDAFNKYSAEHI